MSIYATLMEFGVKRFGDKEFVHIWVQGVPPHIDYVGPEWDFLPPPVDSEGEIMRAVFFVEEGDDKGTSRSGQEYAHPLLVLTGKEYLEIGFEDLVERLEESLDKKYGKRPMAIFYGPDGKERLFHE